MDKKIMDYGIVYLLTNPAMPGLVKIGMTTRSTVEARMKELFGTSVPVPFECAYACKVKAKDCGKIEKALHIAFHPYRIHPQREFFEINPEQAEVILRLLDRSGVDITQEIAAEIDDDLTPTDREAGKKMKIRRRPPLNFTEMGIPIGSILQYGKGDSEITVTVCSDRKVIYQGQETSLTAVTQGLLELTRSLQPTPYWTYDGRNLQDIYNETYVLEQE